LIFGDNLGDADRLYAVFDNNITKAKLEGLRLRLVDGGRAVEVCEQSALFSLPPRRSV
jgi:hypothetical protein